MEKSSITNGAAAAAILGAGVGSLIFGICTTLKQSIKAVANFMNFYQPVGPLGGDTIISVGLWLIVWFILHMQLRNRQVDFGKIFKAALVLIFLGLVGTFPPFFDLFGH